MSLVDSCAKIASEIKPFIDSEFLPDNDDASTLMKELLNKLISKLNISSEINKMNLSGEITHSCRKIPTKKQSFCSEFKQMIKCLVGLFGFEYSNMLMTLYATMFYFNDLTEDIKEMKSIQEISQNVTIIHNLLNLSNYSWKCKENKLTRKKGNILNLNNVIIDDDSTYIKNEINNIMENINEYLQDDDISKLEERRKYIYDNLHNIYENIISCEISVNNINQLCINLGDKYSTFYKGYFWKIFEIIYKFAYVDTTTKMNEKEILEFDYFENYFDEQVEQSEKQSSYYINSFESYLNEIYTKTYDELKDFEVNGNIVTNIVKIKLSKDFNRILAKIIFGTLIIISKQILGSIICLEMSGKTTRIQFMQIYQALVTLPLLIVDFSYTPILLVILYYILKVDKPKK